MSDHLKSAVMDKINRTDTNNSVSWGLDGIIDWPSWLQIHFLQTIIIIGHPG